MRKDNIDEKIINEIIHNYLVTKETPKNIALKFGFSREKIVKILKDNDIKIRNYREAMGIDKEKEEKVVNLYQSGKTCKEISKILDISDPTVLSILNKQNVYIRGPKKYLVNHNYFDIIDSEDKAYFLGLIVADGCIFNNSISIGLQERDGYILEKFRESIDYTGVIWKVKGVGKHQNKNAINVYSKKLVESLSKYGVVPRKTFTSFLPDIPRHLHSHFIRGVFDGDGCISIVKGKVGNFSIVGFKDLIEGIQNILVEDLSLKKTNLYHSKYHKEGILYIVYGGIYNLRKIRDYLYKDATIYLTRKKERFDLL